MQQLNLLHDDHIHTQEVQVDGVRAVFEELGGESYDVTLDINSQKFLIHMTATADQIEQFEIRVAKSFYDLTHRVVLLLRRVVEHLWSQLSRAS